MTSKIDQAKHAGRRGFLKSLLITGGAAAVVAIAPQAQASVESSPRGKAAPDAKGYRVTDHIRHYYDTARL